MTRTWDFLTRLTHIGVDPAKPRHETKHIVLTNVFAVLAFLTTVGPSAVVPAPTFTRVLVAASGVAGTLTLLLNRMRLHGAASAWLIACPTVTQAVVGLREPEGSGHSLFFILFAALSWFVFPPWRRWASTVMTAAVAATAITVIWALRRFPPAMPADYDVDAISTGNRALLFSLIIAVCIYAAREMARVERELVLEREKSEGLLKREVSHQVAERSRDLGEALARIEAPITSAPLSAGDRFHSRYRVVRALGEGGMGAVYEVERMTDRQRLALKVITGQVSGARAARFAREAEIGARVHHRNLVSILDVGIAGSGTPFLVMDLVLGGSLEGQKHRFGDVGWALPILKQVADGLAALHDAGVVHRDLKPANVLIDGDQAEPHAKISDFGISRFDIDAGTGVDPQGQTFDATAGASTPKGKQLTGTGALIGTPHYMPPEAARGGRTLDSAADIFAFGVVAHELLTGRVPFETPAVFLAMAGLGLPACSFEKQGLPPAVREMLVSCLAGDPAARPGTNRVRDAVGSISQKR